MIVNQEGKHPAAERCRGHEGVGEQREQRLSGALDTVPRNHERHDARAEGRVGAAPKMMGDNQCHDTRVQGNTVWHTEGAGARRLLARQRAGARPHKEPCTLWEGSTPRGGAWAHKEPCIMGEGLTLRRGAGAPTGVRLLPTPHRTVV